MASVVLAAAGSGPVSAAHPIFVGSILDLDSAKDGAIPSGNLIVDASGNLYGVTLAGGTHNSGTVFELSPPAALHDPWTETTIWNFAGNQDGAAPAGPLVMDSSGALYGTAGGGGHFSGGTVFKLTPPATSGAGWTETTIWHFNPKVGGGNPSAGVTIGAGGVLYGTAASFGGNGYGTVFRLTPQGDGSYASKTLWTFTGGADGGNPLSGLLLDKSGNLFGTASRGGTNAIGGVVFELSAPAKGHDYAEITLVNFTGANGLHSAASLIADPAGNLYGTTAFGGANGYGTVFELSPPAGGTSWKQTILCDMSLAGGGIYPFSSLLRDGNGVLWGTTNGYHAIELNFLREDATVFSLTPPAAGSSAWTAATVASLDNKKIGQNLVAGLVADSNRRLFAPIVVGPVNGKNKGSAAGGVFLTAYTGFVTP